MVSYGGGGMGGRGRRGYDGNCGEKYKIHVKAAAIHMATMVCGA